MANISFIVKQKLESAIKILCRDFSSHVKRPGKDFSRNRKLPFEEVIRFLLPLQGQCMDQELFRHFSKKPLFFSTDYRYSSIVPLCSGSAKTFRFCNAGLVPFVYRDL